MFSQEIVAVHEGKVVYLAADYEITRKGMRTLDVESFDMRTGS